MLDPFHDVTEGPVCVLSMMENGDSTSSYATYSTSNNNLLLSAFVDYSTDIAVLIMAFLIHMLFLAGQL